MVSAGARVVRLDRDRAFYPTVLMVVASYYVLFAAMAGSRSIIVECIGLALFIALAIAGFKFNLWLVAAALVGHGVFDFFHAGLIANPGVPSWWPSFCLGYDVVAGAFLAILLTRSDPSAPRI